MGGNIWVKSESKAGSTFFFTIPLLIGEEDKSAAIEPVTATDLAGVKILAADDSYQLLLLDCVMEKLNG